MAQKKPAAKAAPVKKAKGNDEKAAKKAERLAAAKERAKNRPEGQRANSKTIDVIDLANGGKVTNYGYAIRKIGTLVTSVVTDAKGNVLSSSITLVEGVKVKAKKGHGMIIPGVAGVGKKGKEAEAADEDEDEDDE